MLSFRDSQTYVVARECNHRIRLLVSRQLFDADRSVASMVFVAQAINTVSPCHALSPAPTPVSTSLLRCLLSGLVP
jgi:hypothetical protein